DPARDGLPDERRHVGIAIMGPRTPRHWSNGADRLDFFDLKGMVQALCDAFRVPVSYTPARHPSLHPGRSADVCAAPKRLGMLGQRHPTIAERFDLDSTGSDVFVAELDFEDLLAAREPLLTVQTPSRFPPSDRDIAIVVDEATPHAEI